MHISSKFFQRGEGGSEGYLCFPGVEVRDLFSITLLCKFKEFEFSREGGQPPLDPPIFSLFFSFYLVYIGRLDHQYACSQRNILQPGIMYSGIMWRQILKIRSFRPMDFCFVLKVSQNTAIVLLLNHFTRPLIFYLQDLHHILSTKCPYTSYLLHTFQDNMAISIVLGTYSIIFLVCACFLYIYYLHVYLLICSKQK